MNDQQQQGMDANAIITKFQKKLSDAMTQIVVLETELDTKNAQLADLQSQNGEITDVTVE